MYSMLLRVIEVILFAFSTKFQLCEIYIYHVRSLLRVRRHQRQLSHALRRVYGRSTYTRVVVSVSFWPPVLQLVVLVETTLLFFPRLQFRLLC